MATLSVKNVNKRSPIGFVKLKRVINIGIIPMAVTTIKGLWEGDETQLNKVLLVLTITIPGLVEVIGMLLAEDPIQVNSDDVTVTDTPVKNEI